MKKTLLNVLALLLSVLMLAAVVSCSEETNTTNSGEETVTGTETGTVTGGEETGDTTAGTQSGEQTEPTTDVTGNPTDVTGDTTDVIGQTGETPTQSVPTGTTPTETPTESATAAPTESETPATPTPTETPATPTPTQPAVTPYEDPDFAKEAIGGMLTLTKSEADLHTGTLMLINASCGYDPAKAELLVNGWNVVHSRDASTGYIGFQVYDTKLRSDLLSELIRLQRALVIETGTTKQLVVGACYLTKDALEDKESDKRFGFYQDDDPNGSEHGAGIAVNLRFLDGMSYKIGDGQVLKESNWIYSNAHKFGFIQRYTESGKSITGHAAEIGHFRYVGIPHATYIYRHNITLEEYIELIKAYTPESPLVITDPYGYDWSVYYVRANEEGPTEVQVPIGLVSDISGNNKDGFIVSVKGTYTDIVFPVDDNPTVLPLTPTETLPAETTLPETVTGDDIGD